MIDIYNSISNKLNNSFKLNYYRDICYILLIID